MPLADPIPAPTDPPGEVVDAAFPSDAGPEAQLRFLLHYAVLAPSVLNTQPWRFAVRGATAEVWADRSRALPALDPAGRELAVSCGAALQNLRVAARHYGFAMTVERVPDPERPDLLGRLTLGAPARATPADEALFRAIRDRRTERHAFADVAVPAGLLREMEAAAEAENAHLLVVTDPADRAAVGALVAEAMETQGADPAAREEILAWLRPDRDPRRDGVRDRYQGVWGRRAGLRESAAAQARRTERMAAESPALLVLATDGDRPADWVAAGMALERALLVAASEGAQASYLNAPVEVPILRARLARAVDGRQPQVVLRVGMPIERGGTPRRPLGDVLT